MTQTTRFFLLLLLFVVVQIGCGSTEEDDPTITFDQITEHIDSQGFTYASGEPISGEFFVESASGPIKVISRLIGYRKGDVLIRLWETHVGDHKGFKLDGLGVDKGAVDAVVLIAGRISAELATELRKLIAESKNHTVSVSKHLENYGLVLSVGENGVSIQDYPTTIEGITEKYGTSDN